LIYELEIPAWEAVLGTEATVAMLDGSVKLKIPPGAQPEQKLRLKGRGLPVSHEARGDLYVKISVTLPKTLTPEQREHWEALAKLPGE
jgi:curved DNA-binding protein